MLVCLEVLVVQSHLKVECDEGKALKGAETRLQLCRLLVERSQHNEGGAQQAETPPQISNDSGLP